MSNYYAKEGELRADRAKLFAMDRDKEHQRASVPVLEKYFDATLHELGSLCPIDYYAARDDMIVGLLEYRYQSFPVGKYPTVYLNMRKWIALAMGQVGMGCPALYVVEFLDGAIKYIKWGSIDARKHKIAGPYRHVKALSDCEPVIEIPLTDMVYITESRPLNAG